MRARNCSFGSLGRMLQPSVLVGGLLALFLALTMGSLLEACQGPGPDSNQAPQLSDEFTDPNHSVDAQGWTNLTLNANMAITHIDSTGHWDTNANYCEQQASGGMDLRPWNRFANLVNKAVQSQVATQDTCFDSICPIDGYNDRIVASLNSGGTRVLFEQKDGQICTKIGDAKTAEKLLQALSQFAISADRQDCDRPYYRCGTLME